VTAVPSASGIVIEDDRIIDIQLAFQTGISVGHTEYLNGDAPDGNAIVRDNIGCYPSAGHQSVLVRVIASDSTVSDDITHVDAAATSGPCANPGTGLPWRTKRRSCRASPAVQLRLAPASRIGRGGRWTPPFEVAMSVRSWIFPVVLAAALGALCRPAQAATYCVDSSLTLATSLAASAASSEADVIRVRTGSYSGIGPIDLDVRGGLSISGGWNLNCLLRSLVAVTTISGTSSQNFKLTQDGNDLSLDGLTFSGWSQVILSDVAQQFGPPVDEIRVSRSRFTGGLIGLFINAGSHNIVVENSRFDGHTSSALQIYRTGDSFGSADVLLHYNTISSPGVATASGLRVQSTNDAPTADIDIYNTVMDGHQFDLRISDQPVRVRNSFWTTQLFTAPGGLALGSINNTGGDPMLDANFRPVEPDSPLINAGVALVGATPSTDYDGGPRVFGIRPDIGAYESNVVGTAVLTVTNTNDSGAGSLRAAITAANSAPGDALIEFNIGGACPHQILLDSGLPTIAKTVRIEGYTQPGSVENTAGQIFDGTVCVFLNGSGDVGGGLSLVTDAVGDEPYVSGLGFYGFTLHAILVAGPGKAQVRGNLFGTGLPLFGDDLDDTAIRVIGATGTVIGGDSVADRNVIGTADQVGIRIDGAGSRTVRNNLIGSNRSGGSLANGIGIRVADGDGDEIRNNTIVYNDAQGILLADGANAPQNTRIINNRIGAAVPSAAVGGNGGNGVRVTGGDGHEIRSNLISNNGTDGLVVLTDSRRVWLDGNRFIGNARLPIDLSPDGRNFNDLDVGQTGANDRQNFPSLFQSGGEALSGTTRAQLSSENGTYIVQVFAGERCTGLGGSGGADDAAVLVGTSEPLILDCPDPTVNCTDAVIVPVTTSPGYPFTGKYLSALVWDEERNTSELGVCFPYEVVDEMFRDGFEDESPRPGSLDVMAIEYEDN
jgi:hypothetical protein